LLHTLFIFLMTMTLLLLTGCNAKDSAAIKIGVVLPLTGEYSIYGKAGLQGAQLAVEQINNAGGVLEGRKLQLVVRDNHTDTAQAIRQSKALIDQENVLALMGPVSSKTRDAVLNVAEQSKVPMLYGIDYEGGKFSRYLFCYSPIPDHYVKPIIPYLANNVGKRFYIYGYDYIWPQKISAAIEQAVASVGGEVVGKEFTDFGRNDFRDVIERIIESEADNLMLILPGQDGFAFIRQAFFLGANKKYQTFAFAADETYLYALRHDELEGVLTALHFFSDSAVPQARTFNSAFNRRFPDSMATYSTKSHYDLIYLLAKAINRAGNTDREIIIDQMEGLTLAAGNDQIRLREDHHFDLPMYLARYERGGLWVKKAFGVISPNDQRRITQK